MAKEFLPLFLDFNETTQDLSDEQCGRLIRALVRYANGEEYELCGVELIAFRFLKGYIDRNRVLSNVRAEAGSKGGQQTAANRSKLQQNAATDSKSTSNSNGDSGVDSEKPPASPVPNKQKCVGNAFVPPSVEEVADFCRERNNGIDPESFVSFYARQGWQLSNGRPMRDWKAAIVTWEKRGREIQKNDVHGNCGGDRVEGQRELYVL